MEYKLRPYQIAAEKAILSEWKDGHKKTVLTLATGLGKTVVFSNVAKRMVEEGHRVLILAHRAELLDQAAAKIKDIIGCNVAHEKAEETAYESDEMITVASVQTLSRDERLKRFPRDYYSVVIVDEAHHCVSPSYQKILQYFNKAQVLGVTATPDRADKIDLGRYFDSEAYAYGMKEGINEGYLCPIKAYMLPLEVDIRGVGMSAGDFSLRGSDEAIMPYLDAIADKIVKDYSDRKTLIFLPLVRTSQKMCRLLNKKGLPAVEVNGETKDRAEKFQAYREGKYKVLCNAMLATEGWDCPPVDCIVILRPTRIKSFYQQMVGRGTRLYPGKKELLLLDFLWLTDVHNLCRPTSLMSTGDEHELFMMERFRKLNEPANLMDLSSLAEGDLTEARESALAKKLAKTRGRKAKVVDPMEYALSVGLSMLIDYEPVYEWEKLEPTKNQLTTIEKNGINPDAVTTKGQAHALISTIIERSRNGYSSPKQIRCLENYGFKHVGKWKFEQASDMIQKISEYNWRVPSYIDAETYNPNNSATKVRQTNSYEKSYRTNNYWKDKH